MSHDSFHTPEHFATLVRQGIETALRADRFRLNRDLKRAVQRGDLDAIRQVAERTAQSVAVRQKRLDALPSRDQLHYPPQLPITAHVDSIVQLIRDHQVIVVCGETGSGKSTQLPKLCIQAGLGGEGLIGHTQPRRLAARSIAARLADEMHTRVGEDVGFKIRFTDETAPSTIVKLMTDGILLTETQSDRYLERYDAIIIDEAHERSLNIDFLLGYLYEILDKRPDLRVIITSATIDAERFAAHFKPMVGDVPIVTVEGRGFPVQTQYLPWEEVVGDAAAASADYDLGRHVCAAVDEMIQHGPGDALVFLPTERDIREVSHRVGG
ncbi:MAG: DEAD/DEAH box helicase, partial [Planctomycetota bacterium]